MTNFNIWTILGAVAVVLLIFFWRKRNAVWGGLMTGTIIGIIVALFYLFKGNKFDWFIIEKGAVAGTLLGFIAELLGKISDHIKKKRIKSFNYFPPLDALRIAQQKIFDLLAE